MPCYHLTNRGSLLAQFGLESFKELIHSLQRLQPSRAHSLVANFDPVLEHTNTIVQPFFTRMAMHAKLKSIYF